jgi:hypothetical protein
MSILESCLPHDPEQATAKGRRRLALWREVGKLAHKPSRVLDLARTSWATSIKVIFEN